MNMIIERFRSHAPGFWNTYRWLIILYIIALLCDALSTCHFMYFGNPDSEIHLGIRIAAKIFGRILGPFIGFAAKAVLGILICIYLRRWTVYILTPVIILSLWAAWYNIWGWKTGYVPNIFRIIPW